MGGVRLDVGQRMKGSILVEMMEGVQVEVMVMEGVEVEVMEGVQVEVMEGLLPPLPSPAVKSPPWIMKSLMTRWNLLPL